MLHQNMRGRKTSYIYELAATEDQMEENEIKNYTEVRNLHEYHEFKEHVLECLSTTIAKYHLRYNDEMVDEYTKNVMAYLENKSFRIEINTIGSFPYQWVDLHIYDLEDNGRELLSKEIFQRLNITSDALSESSEKVKFIQGDTGYQESMRQIDYQLSIIFEPLFTKAK